MTETPIRPLTDHGYRLLVEIAREKPELFKAADPQGLRSELERKKRHSADPETALFSLSREWHPLTSLLHLIKETSVSGPKEDAAHARWLRAALPTLTPADAGDDRVLASINCFHLAEYVVVRWSSSSLSSSTDAATQTKFVKKHWLGHSPESNAAGRLWWLYAFARRAAPHSEHDAEVLLNTLAGNVALYHQMLRRPYLMASHRIRATVLDTVIASGLLEAPKLQHSINTMMRLLNRVGGAISLDVLSDGALREVVEGCLPPKGEAAA